jgi:antitoxin FitA
MATLYICDVPDDVTMELKARASAAGMSLSAYVVRELADITARPTNAEVVKRIRARRSCRAEIGSSDIVDTVRQGRSDRDRELG